MNYKNIALRTLQEFVDENPKMTLGEILYSIFREKNLGVDIRELKTLDEEKIYSAIDRAKQFEKE